ncbi:MAG: NAD(P)-dependent oxidoreductase [Planctomycetes bacterium]|nr:NAD(P)-dependent oxidoreductase [Planctomycetota bacterium]
MSRRSEDCTVGVLYCGDLGAALARTLTEAGIRVVTTCEGRTRQTQERAEAAEIEILPTLDAVVSTADVVVSLVLPNAAEQVARQYADRQHLCPRESLFIDANSVDLQTISAIQTILEKANIRFVDAAIHGGAKTLKQLGVMYLSGRDADDARAIFGSAVRAHSLGDQIGQATRMKLLMAGLSKSLNLLFLEIAILAHEAEMSDQFLSESRAFYPGLMTAIERMLPTYPQHASRRVMELRSIEEMARSIGAPHQIVHSARGLLQAVAGAWEDELRATSVLDISQIIAIAAAAMTTSDPDI